MRILLPTRVGHTLGSRAGRLSLALGTIGILALSGGIAFAAIPSLADGVIHGCYEKRTGLLRVIDVEAGKSCLQWETPIAWKQSGPQGEPGLQGEPGADGGAGAPGADGADGQDGLDGMSVTSEALDPGDDSNCPHGGSKFTSSSGVTYACNGRDGADFAGSFTSPNGLFSVTVSDTGATLQGPSGTVRVTAAGASVVGALVTINGGSCGLLRPVDFSPAAPGMGGGPASLLTGSGSPTVRFGC